MHVDTTGCSILDGSLGIFESQVQIIVLVLLYGKYLYRFILACGTPYIGYCRTQIHILTFFFLSQFCIIYGIYAAYKGFFRGPRRTSLQKIIEIWFRL